MSPQEATALAVLAFSLMQNARPEKAALVLEALDQVAPGQVKTLELLAAALVRSGQPPQALEVLDRIAMAGGAGPVFHLLRAQALCALDRGEESEAAMRTFLQMRPAAAHRNAG